MRGLERPDMGFERLNLGSEKFSLGSQRPNSRLNLEFGRPNFGF